jgi:hypothetical protein
MGRFDKTQGFGQLATSIPGQPGPQTLRGKLGAISGGSAATTAALVDVKAAIAAADTNTKLDLVVHGLSRLVASDQKTSVADALMVLQQAVYEDHFQTAVTAWPETPLCIHIALPDDITKKLSDALDGLGSFLQRSSAASQSSIQTQASATRRPVRGKDN